MDGDIGARVRGLVVEWASLHQDELRRDWTLARTRQPLPPIEPLEIGMSPDIIDVQSLGEHRLLITYADDQRREIDVAALVPFEGVFEPLRDPAYFATVSVNADVGTIVWPNGADFCPDVLRTCGRMIDTTALVP